MPNTSDCAAPATDPRLDEVHGIHHRVVTDETPDTRYHNPVSNKTKVQSICTALGLDESTFDLTWPFPLPEWSQSGDRGLFICGGFLTDLREQFLGFLINEAPQSADHELWEAHAAAEYWNVVFERLLWRTNGVITADGRTLH